MERAIGLIIKAAPTKTGMYGVVRMRAKEGVDKLRGICGEFTADPNFEEVVYAHSIQDLFFYGQEKDFGENFRNDRVGRTLAKALFPIHLEVPYHEGKSEMHYGEGFARIPLQAMRLAESQLELIAQVEEDVSKILPRILVRANLEEMPEEGTRSYTSILGHFKRFPQKLFELAEKERYYFKAVADDKVTINPQIQQKPKVWFSSFGGMTSKAKVTKRLLDSL